jgi:SAM-dependent methyltransferase
MTSQEPERAHFYERHQEWPSATKRAIAEHLLATAGASPRVCLFLGAATGVNDAVPFARAADPGDRIIAGDVDEDCLARLREVIAAERFDNVESRRIDIRTDLADLDTFDLVTLLFVIHRLADWRPVVPRLPALLKPGAFLCVSEFAGPDGVIYLSNEGGDRSGGPVARLIARYFELLPETFAPELKSTSISPVRDALAEHLTPAGHQDFSWRQRLTVGEMYQKIASKAYAPYVNTQPSTRLLDRLRDEFRPDWHEADTLMETIRVYRFCSG